MNISLYLDRETWIHHLDARAKVLAVLGLFTLALLYDDPLSLVVLLGVLMLCVVKAEATKNVRNIWPLLILLFLYSTLLWPFFFDGQTTILQWSFVTITSEGVVFGLAMGLRLNVMVISGVLLLSTTTLEDFASGLQRFGVPVSMGFAFSLAFRWVPTLLGASGVIVQAQRSRGLDLTTGTLVDKIRGYAPLVVPLIGHTLRQTTLLAMAIESKGFSPRRCRYVYHRSHFGFQDYGVLLIMGVFVGVSCWFSV
ncbi:MAG: energy-coupling factor transporter transmembrane component T family protein [Nitrospirales bacterium]